jgi:hypothetical protein
MFVSRENRPAQRGRANRLLSGGASGGEAGNMAFVLAAAALAVGTVMFVGSARKGAPEAKKVEAAESRGAVHK